MCSQATSSRRHTVTSALLGLGPVAAVELRSSPSTRCATGRCKSYEGIPQKSVSTASGNQHIISVRYAPGRHTCADGRSIRAQPIPVSSTEGFTGRGRPALLQRLCSMQVASRLCCSRGRACCWPAPIAVAPRSHERQGLPPKGNALKVCIPCLEELDLISVSRSLSEDTGCAFQYAEHF